MPKAKKKKLSENIRRYGMPIRIKQSNVDLVNQLDPHKTRPFNTKLERILEACVNEGVEIK